MTNPQPQTSVVESVAITDRIILLEDAVAHDGDWLALTDFYPGQSVYTDFATYDIAKVVQVRGRVVEIERETPRAHPCRSRVKVISRLAPPDLAFRA